MSAQEAGRVAFAARWGFAPESTYLRAALTHRSAAPTRAQASERLEFLGDALLGAFVARYLLERFPDQVAEGALTEGRKAVIAQGALASVGRELGLSGLIAVGEGERREGRQGQDRLLADAYEALVGAMALESGEEAARAFVLATLGPQLDAVVAAPPERDPKNQLQERLQKRGFPGPVYTVIAHQTDGRKHHFVVQAQLDGRAPATGEGASRQQAERQAARAALVAWDAEEGDET